MSNSGTTTDITDVVASERRWAIAARVVFGVLVVIVAFNAQTRRSIFSFGTLSPSAFAASPEVATPSPIYDAVYGYPNQLSASELLPPLGPGRRTGAIGPAPTVQLTPPTIFPAPGASNPGFAGPTGATPFAPGGAPTGGDNGLGSVGNPGSNALSGLPAGPGGIGNGGGGGGGTAVPTPDPVPTVTPTDTPTPTPTTSPTPEPTASPTATPTPDPTGSPTPTPTTSPTATPTPEPTTSPTPTPTASPTGTPTPDPTPTTSPTPDPTPTPTQTPDPVVPPTNPVGAVPEPATWAMMIMGFGLIGGQLRRRRRRSSADRKPVAF